MARTTQPQCPTVHDALHTALVDAYEQLRLLGKALDAYATLADTTPAQVHWGHVGTITEVVRHLKEIAV